MSTHSSLRIALSAGFWRDLGTYWRAYHIGRELSRRGHRVTLFCISNRSRWIAHSETVDGLEVVECPHLLNRPLISHGLGPLDIAYRVRALSREHFDVVHGFEYFADVTLPILLMRRRHQSVYISDWCDWFSRIRGVGKWLRLQPLVRILGWLEDTARRPAHGVTVISRSLERHVRDLGFGPDQVLYLPGGAPVDAIQPIPSADARAELGMKKEWRIVAYMASSYAPGMEQFAEPLAALGEEMPDLRVMLIGHMERRLGTTLEALGMKERLIRPGFVPEERLPLYLAAADVCLIGLSPGPYNEARWPAKLGEYLAAGRPVIVTNVGDTPEVIANAQAGLVVNGEPGDIQQKLSRLLREPHLAVRMGANARKLAEGELAWPRLVDRLEDFYHRQVAANKARSGAARSQ